MDLIKKLTGKNPDEYENVAKSLVDNSDVNLFSKLVKQDDFLFDFVKNNVAKRIRNACNKDNYLNLLNFTEFYSASYDDMFADILYQYGGLELLPVIKEIFLNGTESQKAYAVKFFSLVPEEYIKDLIPLLRTSALSKFEPLAINSIEALSHLGDEVSKEEALVKVEKDLKTFFFDNKTKINSMNMDTFYALSDNILRKYNIIPNNTQLNFNKAKISAKNSFENLLESFFAKKYGDKNWDGSSKAEMVSAITSAVKDMADIGIKLQSANTIQETKNLTQLSIKEAINFLKNKNMLKTNSEEYLTYKMKQNMPGADIK